MLWSLLPISLFVRNIIWYSTSYWKFLFEFKFFFYFLIEQYMGSNEPTIKPSLKSGKIMHCISAANPEKYMHHSRLFSSCCFRYGLILPTYKIKMLTLLKGNTMLNLRFVWNFSCITKHHREEFWMISSDEKNPSFAISTEHTIKYVHGFAVLCFWRYRIY